MRHCALILNLILAGHFAGCAQPTHCEESVDILDSSSKVSPIVGVSADELLASVGVEHVINVSFTSDDEILSQSPEGSNTELTLRFVGDPGEVREVDSRYIPGDTDIALECRSRLEVDLRVEITTADGTFNETWDAVLSSARLDDMPSDTEDVAVLTADFSPSDIQGDYQIVSHNNPTSPDAVRGQMIVTFGELDSLGEIDILVEEGSAGDDDDQLQLLAIHRVLTW